MSKSGNVAGALNVPIRQVVIGSSEWVHQVGSDGMSIEDSVFLADGRVRCLTVVCQ